MKLVPLFDRVVLEQVKAEETTKSGIVLPGQDKEKPSQAVVIAVGPGLGDGKTKMEAFLKDFNTESAVNEFVNSDFFSVDVNYDVLWKRFKEYCFEFNTKSTQKNQT